MEEGDKEDLMQEDKKRSPTGLVALRPVGDHPLKGPGAIQQPLCDFSEGLEDSRGGRGCSGPSLSLQMRKLRPTEGPPEPKCFSSNVSLGKSSLKRDHNMSHLIGLSEGQQRESV